MNYVLFNHLSNNGAGETRADALYTSLGVKADDPAYKKIDLVGLNLSEWMKDITADDLIYLVAGDGTLNRIANELDGVEIPCPVLLISGGTGNDFLRDIVENYPTEGYTDIREYIKNLPTIRVNGKECHFLNGIGYGIDGMCCEVADKKKAEGKKKIDYTALTINLLMFHYKCPTATVVLDDGKETTYEKVWLASAMNGRYYGGGMKAAPDQDRKGDGLTFLIWHGSGKIGTLADFPSIFKGEHVKKKSVTVIPAKKIKVKFDIPTAMQIDGETVLNVSEYEAWK
ncbi:MAG: diacylglycerol kinase family protein [Lachnospiraceae bacterium]|nr:diacylglycerol kinase family protein [Lachnospiraceae bacterium]